jgi:DNA-binding GntR family transcriptional regulator
MPLSPVALNGERSLASEVHEWLRNAILSGELRPRERLIEKKIAELADVSRTPVREALKRLELDGLVKEGGGGLHVSMLSLHELGDLCAVRETLEVMATELATSLRSEIELAALRNLVGTEGEALSREPTVLDELVMINHAFHETLWQASRNRVLAAELARLRNLIEGLQDTSLRDRDRLARAAADHARILAAIEAGDADAAGRLAREHFRDAMITRLAMTGSPVGSAAR